MDIDMAPDQAEAEPLFHKGDLVFSTETIVNDGFVPELPEGAVLATPGTRGMVVTYGHAEEAPECEIYLIRFELPDGRLGPPVGCLPGELTQDAGLARQLAANGA